VAPEKRDVGMVFQSYALWPHMTVFENVAFPMKMARRPRASLREQVGQALRVVGLTGLENRFPSQLSGGQQQRVALARAIVTNPKLLLFDEPLSNLDAKLRESMRLELREIHERMGWTALYVTHDRTEAMTMSDRVVVLKDGVIQQVGVAVELYNRPMNIFVAEFLGDMNYSTASGPDGKPMPNLRPPAANLAITGSVSRIGFRPEALRLTPHTGGKTPTGAWLGQIRAATNLGWYVEYVVEVKGVALKLRSQVDAALPVGAMVNVWPNYDQALRFEGTRQTDDGDNGDVV
jgi:iron(III) transport system ATP-binding protein